MKKTNDPRHLKRIKVIQELFAFSFYPEQNFNPTTIRVIKNLPKIDKLIEKAAPEWPLAKIAKVDLAILRLAVFELIIDKKQPFKVIIDEAVELAKEFGNERSSSFVNGVLGTILKSENEPNKRNN